MPGTRLRFFSGRVFGAWVEGTVTKVCPTTGQVTVKASFYGAEWTETLLSTATLYRPQGHSDQGYEFRLDAPAPKTKVSKK